MPYDQLEELMQAAGEASARDLIEFRGGDPVFPTPMRLGDLGAATIGASAVQAARLWQMRTGRMQSVSVDVDAAAIAMRASRYIRRELAPGETAPIATGRTSVGRAAGVLPDQGRALDLPPAPVRAPPYRHRKRAAVPRRKRGAGQRDRAMERLSSWRTPSSRRAPPALSSAATTNGRSTSRARRWPSCRCSRS